jgi:alkylhydroperoxidase family enzyme
VITRVPALTPDEWTDEVRSLFGGTVAPVAALEGDSGHGASKPLNILAVIARQPRLLGPFLGWAAALALEGELPRRDHELLALRAAWNCRSSFEWAHHVVYARAAGFTDDEIERVAQGPHAGWSEEEATLLHAADQLHLGSMIDDATWDALARRFEPPALVEICFVVGQYTMLSMVANATGVEVEDGLDSLPKDADIYARAEGAGDGGGARAR